jgi:hypothetical protein
MNRGRVTQTNLIDSLRRALPLSAHPRPTLVVFLRERGVVGRGSPRLVIVDVFDAGAAGGLMCRFAVAENKEAAGFITPLAQVALDRRHSIALSRPERRLQTAAPGAA